MGISELVRELARLRSTLRLLRRGLVRLGSVKTVDLTACTIVVEYDDTDEDDAPVESESMPWLQRSTEHQPPVVGDHVVVLDPSLGHGAALAIVGWPSTAKPAPESAGEKHVIVSQYGGLIQMADDATITANNCTIDIDGNTQIPETLDVTKETTLHASLTVTDGGPVISASSSGVDLAGGADAVTLNNLVTVQLNILKTIFTLWVPVPMDGGAALKTALTAGLATWPASMGATKVKAT